MASLSAEADSAGAAAVAEAGSSALEEEIAKSVKEGKGWKEGEREAYLKRVSEEDHPMFAENIEVGRDVQSVVPSTHGSCVLFFSHVPGLGVCCAYRWVGEVVGTQRAAVHSVCSTSSQTSSVCSGEMALPCCCC